TIVATTSLPVLHVPVTIDGGHHIALIGSGLDLAGGKSTVKGLVIDKATTGIILDSAKNDIEDNYILGNFIGVIAFGPANTIKKNVISGNGFDGIHLLSDGNQVQGNKIGTDVTGLKALGNGGSGVAIFGGAQKNLIGT